MTQPDRTRPPLTRDLTGTELRRWYWLKDELAVFARQCGLSAAGDKQELTDRVADFLDGRPVAAPVRRSAAGPQLTGPLSGSMPIPPGQRCSQVVRGWFVAQVGSGFRFDGPMRGFFAATDGTQTLDDALRHWHATRDRGPDEIGGQFELNRFARRWHAAHPGGSHGDMLSAWREYRALPVEERDGVAPS